MHRSRVRYILNVLLLAASVAVVMTGLLVDRLDLNAFAPHRWAGYVAAVLLAVHAGLHWRWFLPTRRIGAQGHEPGPSMDAPGSGAPGDAARSPAPLPGDSRVSGHPSRRMAIATVGAGVTGLLVGWFTRSGVSPTPYRGGDVGLFYHRESSLGLSGLLSDVVSWGRRPAPYLSVGDGEAVALPALEAPPGLSVAQALEQRRSLREYADRALSAQELAWVVRAATGITSAQGLRTAPSAGALYPLETYVAVARVDGIDPGLYHVDVRAQALEPVRRGSVAGDLMVAGLGQDFLRRAPAVLVVTGLFQRSRWKYRERHYRYVCWEGGHLAQNAYLAAESLGLGACMVGAFLDGMVNDLVGADGQHEAALGLIAVGPR